jgi:hypothetical protein
MSRTHGAREISGFGRGAKGSLLGGAFAALALLLGTAAGARADDTAAVCSALESEGSSAGFEVVDTHELTRVQARPWAILPRGISLLVRAPKGTSEANLHAAVSACAKTGHGAVSKSDAVEVRRHGGLFVVELTSERRSSAITLSGLRETHAQAAARASSVAVTSARKACATRARRDAHSYTLCAQ